MLKCVKNCISYQKSDKALFWIDTTTMMSLQTRITVPSILDYKKSGNKIVACTAYDFTMASLVDSAGVDIVLVGDSLASVVQGEETTLAATMDQMIYHCRCVTKAVSHSLVVGDMPFMSYQPSISQAIESAGRFLKEGGVSAVKLEGGVAVADIIARMVELDIPVMAHVGLTPQSYHRMGGHRLQGKDRGTGAKPGSREKVLLDARAVEEAGAFAVVLEGIPADLALEITSELSIPTIGIGAGSDCDGQILVINDLLGFTTKHVPSFVKQYAQLAVTITSAVGAYAKEVRSSQFPEKGLRVKPLSRQAF